MSTKRLLSTADFHAIPPIIRNSLQWAHNSTTQSNSPFLPKGPSVLATNLIKSYSERGLMKEARTLFDEMPERDVVAWTAMIAGYTSCNHYSHAWVVFCEMVRNGIEPNDFTLSSALKGCKGMKALSYGTLVHGLAIKHGMKESMYVNNALMDMYATCCVSMDEACMVFQEIHAKYAVSWTTLITGYTHGGDGYGGLRVFRQMLLVSS
jgi:pentatricopeptide repeat protein